MNKRWKLIGPDFFANTEHYVFMLKRYSGKYKLFMRVKSEDKRFTDLDVEFMVNEDGQPDFNEVNEYISTAYPEACLTIDHSKESIINAVGMTDEEGEKLIDDIGHILTTTECPSEFLERVILKCNADPAKVAFVFYTISRIMHAEIKEIVKGIEKTSTSTNNTDDSRCYI